MRRSSDCAADWTTSPEVWEKSRRCRMCGWQLFPPNARSGEVWAATAYEKLSATGISPESQRDARAPGLLDLVNVVVTVTPLT